MTLIDAGFDRSRPQVIGYRDPELSPFVVTRQTNHIIWLCETGLTGKPIRDYLHDFTNPFLETSSKTGITLFDTDALRGKLFDPEAEEASRLTFAVMANMHIYTTIENAPESFGFSRSGVLKAPSTYQEYSARIEEIQEQLELISSGYYGNSTNRPFNWGRLRTYSFFQTAAILPLHLPKNARERAEEEREKLHRIYGDIDTNI